MDLKECLVFFALCATALCMERKMTVSVNPGCTKCSSMNPLIHVSAEGPYDIINHIWDFTFRPTLLLAVTPLNTSLVIDWDRFLDGSPGSLKFTNTPSYMFSVIFNKVIEFNDVDNTGIYSNSTDMKNVKLFPTEYFNWTLVTTWSDTHTAQTTIVGNNFLSRGGSISSALKQTGSVTISLSAYGVKDHGKAEPHLLHTTNSTQFDIALDHLTTSFAQSRFAVEMVAVSSDTSNASVTLKTHKNIDDENTPGIFTVAEYMTPESEEGHLGGGYLQWRTVAYMSRQRTFVNTTKTHESYPYIVQNPSEIINGTTIYSLVGSLVRTMSVHLFTVSFGMPDDAGYYAKTNYLLWSFLAGYGQPAGESFSLLVVVLLTVALNIIALLVVVAYVLIFTRRIRRNKNDLFFSH